MIMAVISPADDIETRQATSAIADWPGPVYMRLFYYPVPRVCDEEYRFEVGKATTLREGGDVAIFAAGHMVCKALDAAELLGRDGIGAKAVTRSDGTALSGGEIKADEYTEAVYNLASNRYEISTDVILPIVTASAWVNFDGTGVVSLNADFNITSIQAIVLFRE